MQGWAFCSGNGGKVSAFCFFVIMELLAAGDEDLYAGRKEVFVMLSAPCREVED